MSAPTAAASVCKKKKKNSKCCAKPTTRSGSRVCSAAPTFIDRHDLNNATFTLDFGVMAQMIGDNMGP